MKIGRAIKEVRKKRGISQGDLATRLSISQSYLSLVEGEKKQPSLDLLQSIADTLDISIPILFLLSIEPADLSKKNKAQAKLAYSIARSLLDILS